MTFNETIRRQARGEVLSHEHPGDEISGELIGSILHTDNLLGPWKIWTPSYVNLTPGNATVVARYLQLGKLVIARFRLDFGSTTTIDGSNPTISAPVTARSGYAVNRTPVGQVMLRDDGVANFVGIASLAGSLVEIRAQLASGTHLQTAAVTATVPFTWGTSDVLAFTITYEAA